MGAKKKEVLVAPTKSARTAKKKESRRPLSLVLLPAAFCILFVGIYASNPRLVDTIIPLRALGLLPWCATVTDFLPPHPKNFFDAWSFGKLEERLDQLEFRNENTTEAIDLILQDAAVIAKRPVSMAELRAVRELIIDIDNETGIVGKVLGFFTFVNIIWIVSFLGLLITIIPCILVCAKPLEQMIIAFAFLLKKIFLSKIAFFFYEIFSWIFVSFWTIAAHQYPPEYNYLLGFFAVGWYFFFLYAWLKYHGYYSVAHNYSERWGASMNPTATFVNAFMGLFAFPMTFLFRSSLIGWVSVICLYSILGFTIIGGGLCYFIGFNSKETCARCVVTSFLFIVLFSAYKIAGLPVQYLIPFASPLMILGNTVYFLGLLIIASSFYSRRNAEQYIIFQMLMILSIILAFFVGAVFSIAPMFNVAGVFFVMFIFEKVIELDVWRNGAGIWVLGFLLSVSLFIISFFLHGHPGIIVSLFDSSWLITPP